MKMEQIAPTKLGYLGKFPIHLFVSLVTFSSEIKNQKKFASIKRGTP